MQLYTIAMAIFLIMVAAILFGSHFSVYISVVKFFKISGPQAKIWLGAVLFVLGTSYIASSILAHINENNFTKTLYYFSGLWLGMLNNLFMAFAGAWAVYWIGRLMHIDVDMRAVGTTAAILALALSAYGAWNAFNQRTKDITVKMKNLPLEWQGKTVVQISDVHIGHVFDHAFLEKVVTMINSVKPEAVFITGDLFDGMDGNYDMRMLPLNGIEAPKGVYFITGNHETYFGLDKVKDILAKTNVRMLDDSMVDLGGLQVIGASYPERGDVKNIADFLKNLPGFKREMPSILLYHSPTHIPEARDAGINLQLSGHTHKGQVFPYNFITQLVYKGYDYGLFQEGDFNLYTTNGTGAWGPTMRIGNTPEIVSIRLEKK